jgi:hypothetical protein
MIYTPYPLYRLFAWASALLVALFMWELRTGLEIGALLFLGLTLGLTLHFMRMAGSRVEVLADRIRLLRPYSATHEVEFRQMEQVYEEGRGVSAILVAYYPRQPDGLLDLDDLKHLALPAVRDHVELFTTLTARLPQSS